jgi:membrane protease YdiL (CAAX protease family)
VLRSGGVLTLGSLRRWVWLLPMFLINFAYLVPGVEAGATPLISSAVVLLSVGVSEEIAGRGVALQLARPIGDHASAWIVAAVFGLGHLGNYLFFGAGLGDTLWQILGSTLFGFCLGAARFVVGSIWPLALIHAMDDWMQINSPGAAPFWFQVTVMAFNLVFGYVLLAANRAARAAPHG